MVTVWWSAACLIYYNFLNPSKTITSEKYAQQINEMHQNPQCLHLVSVHRKGLILSCDNTWPHIVQPMLQMLHKSGQAVTFCLICHFHLTFHQLTTTSSCSLTTFAGKILQQPVGHRKCFPRVRQIPEYRFLCYRNKLISCLQKCVDCNGSYFN